MTESADIKIANSSGFPLQIAIENFVSKTRELHGWRVRCTEHAWTNQLDEQSGFIDLVLEDKYEFANLVIECKRVREASWLFMNSAGSTNVRSHVKLWASHYKEGRMRLFDWCHSTAEPRTPEAAFCVVPGQSANDRSPLLERTAGELISATEALAIEERDFRPNNEHIRMYGSVIVTTARLKIAKFSPENISLTSGMIEEGEIEEVPFLRFRKQLSMRSKPLTPEDYDQRMDLAYGREHTVFVVRADALGEFLHEFEVTGTKMFASR